MRAAKTILIADDHALLREGMRALLSAEPDLSVIGEAANGRDAVRMTRELKPRLVLMDLSMPGMSGLDAIAEIRRRSPEVKILVVTLHRSEDHVQSALRCGASGYLLKESGHGELLAAIRTLLRGNAYLSPDLSERIVRRFLAGDAKPATAWETLTLRERQVMKLVAEGNGNRDVAAYLSLSVKTIEKHRATLMHKLCLRNACELTAYAIEKGLVTESRKRDRIGPDASVSGESGGPCS